MSPSRLFAAAIVGFTLIACSSAGFGTPPGSDEEEDSPKKTKSATCSSASAGEDPSTLTACTGTKGTKGRCVSTSKNPDAKVFEKASCKSGEACVPDAIVRAGGVPELPKCKAVLDAEGRCFSPLASDVVKNYDLLKGATGSQCEGGDVCVPCKDPTTNEATGVCEVTAGGGGEDCSDEEPPSDDGPRPGAPAECPYKGTPIDTATFKQDSCGAGLLCVPKNLVPTAQQSQLSPCSSGLCAPKKSVQAAGMFLPKTCRSLANAEGRCLAAGLPAIAAQSALPRADCDADEKCAPCFDPITGKETGACTTVPCDKPVEPAKSFSKCCGGKGSCLPESLVPSGDRDNFDDEGCKEDVELCLPTELAASDLTKAAPCKFNGLSVAGIQVAGPFNGACISDCFDTFPPPPQANCAGGTVCVPCSELPAGTTACGK